MRRIALLVMPLLVLGLAPLSADTAAQVEGHELTIPTITPVESSGDMMMASKDMMMMDVQHTHDMGTADDTEDDVTHTHSLSHTHDMGTEDTTDDVTHDHGEYGHTHDEEDMINAPGHIHDFHAHDDDVHYHLGGFGDHDHVAFQAGPTVELKGSSTLRFGMDLSTNATGFRNESDLDLKVIIIPKQTKTHPDGDMMGTDDLYAQIELKDFKWEVTSADGQGKTTVPAITTTLSMGPFSLKTFNKPSIDIDYVDGNDAEKGPKFDPIDPDKDKDAEVGYKDFSPDVSTTYKGSGGLELGYEIDPVTLTLRVLSANDWAEETPKAHKLDSKIDLKNCVMTGPKVGGTPTDTHQTCDVVTVPKTDNNDQNDENAYAFLGKAKVLIGESANVEFAVAYAHNYKAIGPGELNDNDFLNQDKVDDTGQAVDDIGLGAQASFDLLDSDGDGDNDLTTTIAFDGRIPSGADSIPWDVGGGVEWGLSADDESTMGANLMMHVPAAGAESSVSIMVTLKEGDGDKGALAGLGAELAVRLDGLTGDASTWTTNIKAHYDVEGIKPFFAINFSSAEGATTAFKAGIELAVVDHLTTTLMYRSTDITGGKKGDVTAALKVSY